MISALFLPQLTFLDGVRTQQSLWASPEVRQRGLQVDITPTAAGLQGMREYRIAFPTWSTAAAFCPAHLQHLTFDQLVDKNSNDVHMGCQVGKAYRVVLQEGDKGLLAFTTQARKKSNQKGEESPYDKVRRLSSPRAWDVALVPFPEDFAPLPTQAETGLACQVSAGFSLCTTAIFRWAGSLSLRAAVPRALAKVAADNT